MGKPPGCVHLAIHRTSKGTHVCSGCGQMFVPVELAAEAVKVLEVEVREGLKVSVHAPRAQAAAAHKAAQRHSVPMALPFDTD